MTRTRRILLAALLGVVLPSQLYAQGGFGPASRGGGTGSGTGSVTSIGLTSTNNVTCVVSNSPVTTAGNIVCTPSGTSGGIPYFSSASALVSSGALSVNDPVLGGGAGATPVSGTRTGTTTKFVTATTSVINAGEAIVLDASGNAKGVGYAPAAAGTGLWVNSTPTLTPTDFNQYCPIITINTPSLTIKIPTASTLQANGGCAFIVSPLNAFTLSPTGSDTLNGVNANITYGKQTWTLITSDGSSKDAAVPMSTLNGGNVWAGGINSMTPTILTISGSKFTPDGTSNHYIISLTSACPCTLDTPSVTFPRGMDGSFEILQDGSGSRTITTWGVPYIIQGGTAAITLSTPASSETLFPFHVNNAGKIELVLGSSNATH